MKKCIVFLFLLPLFSFAQECSLKKVVDKFSQQPKLTTGLVSFKGSKGSFQLTADVTATEIDILFSLNSEGSQKCFDDASSALILFDGNRSRLTIRNSGSMNCDGYFHFIFRNTNPVNYNLQRLTNFKVASFKFTNDKVVTEITLDDEAKKLFNDLMACIAKEAPSMIKAPQ